MEEIKLLDGYDGYMVSTRCYTYNHAPYIEETLHGFAIQKISFPVVFCVVDDASTDGEQEVLKKWVDEHLLSIDQRPVWEEKKYGKIAVGNLSGNERSTFVVLLLSENHNAKEKKPLKLKYIEEWNENAKYQAICEGDDYWIDPLKLQKQVDFMEANLDFGLIHTDFDLVEGRKNHDASQPDVIIFPELLTKHYNIGTPTVLYRNSIYKETPKCYLEQNWPMGDFPKWIEIHHESKIKYLRVITAKYRVLKNSASHKPDIKKTIAFINAGHEIKRYYSNKYGLASLEIYDSNYYEEIIRAAAHLGSKDVAKEYLKKAREKDKLTFKSFIFFLSAKYPFLKRLIDIYIEI